MTEAITDKIRPIIEEVEQEWEERLRAHEERIKALEESIATLQEELAESLADPYAITDEILRERLARLGKPPLDTIIREAGVVLEDRLRTLSEADGSLHGTSLVDAVFSPDRGRLVFSEHAGEQEGVRMLYRGAMQFIRNPPMHKLVEYPENTARLLVRLIDSLLLLLAEGTGRDEVSLEDVRRMLRRRRIREGQIELYKAIYAAGETGLSSRELAETLGRTPQQISGVLGALGRRINNTPGLEGKGGIAVVLEIWEGQDGDWHYRMRPILQQALELEKLV